MQERSQMSKEEEEEILKELAELEEGS